jgi:glycosyltransferase involved in cell wall biosynthesis
VSRVSVIMPTYNAAQWVADSIDSVIAQTYSDVELIVVDDGSQDDTVAVVRQKLERDFRHDWRVIGLPSNQGPSAARNAGLRAASGAWVQFLDSDDFLAPTKLEVQMASCADAPADLAAVYSPFRMCYVDAGEVSWEGPLVDVNVDGRPPIMCLVGGFRPLHSAGLARRSVLEQIGGFDETLRFWECEELNVRIAGAGRLAHVPAPGPTYLWRMHRDKSYIGGATARYHSAPVALGWMELVLKAAGQRPLDQLALGAAERRALLNDCTVWARLLYATDRAAFRRFIGMARRLDPDIRPAHPGYVAWAARHVGYEAAESMAKLARAPRRLARRALQGLRLRGRTAVLDLD